MASLAIVRRATRVRDRLLEPIDRAVIAANPSGPLEPLFVLGVPRSGTTAVYQVLAAAIRCGYFSNRECEHALWPALSAFVYRGAEKFEASYESERGKIRGPDAPSDGWEVFQRYFPTEHDPVLHDRERGGLRSVVGFFEGLYDAPFFVKNNANTLRIVELHRLFPEATFVYVQRDLLSNVRSLLEARRAVDAPLDRFWSCGPAATVHQRAFSDELEHVVYQCLFLDAYVTEAVDRVGIPRVIPVQYEQFVESPQDVVDRVLAVRPDWPRRSSGAGSSGIGARTERERDPEMAEQVESLRTDLGPEVQDAVARALVPYALLASSVGG